MDQVVHFEIPANDIQRAKKFYEKMFGWKITQFQAPDMTMEYFSVVTKEKDAKNAINGGMMKRSMPNQPLTIYVYVKSVEGALQNAVKNGGKIALPKTFIGKDESMGSIGAFFDTENNLVGVVKMPPMPMPKKKAAKKKK